jgi:hypothetical protein
MTTQEMVDLAAYNLKHGESRENVAEYLATQGLTAEEVEGIFAKIPKEKSFWQDTPFYPYFAEWDAKTAQLPPRVILGIGAGLILLVIVMGFLMYFLYRPGAGGSGDARDLERETHYTILKEALSRYHNEHGMYPAALEELAPGYINIVPHDPGSKELYGYGISAGGGKYSLCIHFEKRAPLGECLNTEALSAEELGLPTGVPEPEQAGGLGF